MSNAYTYLLIKVKLKKEIPKNEKKVLLSKKTWNLTFKEQYLQLYLVPCFQRVQYGKEEKINFTVQKSGKH